MKIKLSNEDIKTLLNIESPEFPKYVTQILNLANQNAQGTRPIVVGQMTELIREFPGHTVTQWVEWYSRKNPEGIKNATNKIYEMVNNLKESINKIDREMVSKWVEDLVIIKTFIGLRFQEAVVKRGAELKGLNYRLASPEDESKSIDGYIGSTPVSIKPETYDVKRALPEKIDVRIIYYKKIKDGIEVNYNELL